MAQKLRSQLGFFDVAKPTSPSEYVTVGGVTGIRDIRSGTATEIDVSDLSSLAKEYILGLADNGSMTLDVFYDPNDPGQVILEQLRESAAANVFRIGIKNPLGVGSPALTTTIRFTGFVQTFPIALAVDAAVTGSVTIRITGAITKN
jgi:hypothetical protein